MMQEISFLREFLASVGDVATIIFVVAYWRLDRRLVVVETKTGVKNV